MELTDAQRHAISHIDGNLQIIACAGSGKTEVISRRIANILLSEPNVNPNNIVAFTFTEKAAASLKDRIEKASGGAVDGIYIGTIHGFCKHLLSEYTERFADFTVLDTVKNHHFITRFSDKCGMAELSLRPCALNNGLFLQCIDKLIDDYDNRASWTDVHRRTLEQYINCLYEHKYIDFSLLLFEALRQIEENPSVREYLGQVRYLIVDEYQDVNDLQEKLIKAIADIGANICVVGDDDQTIYQFRGSNADNMISFPERYKNVTQIRLEENFRCGEGIVDVAATIIKRNKRRLDKQMVSGAKNGENTVEAWGYGSAEAENSAIADRIATLHESGIPYQKMAILVRKGKHVMAIASALSNRGIPYTADSAEDFFEGNYFNRFVETLRMLDSLDKSALYDRWEDIADGASFNAAFRYLRGCTRGGRYRLSEIIRSFCEKIGFLNESASDLKTREEDLNGFTMILEDYDEIYGDYQLSARITGLLRFLGTQAAQEYKYHNFREKQPDEDAVQLMTVHKSKGLEFHTVFLPRLNKREFPVMRMGGRQYYHILGGTFADNKGKYESDIEDERKLFYVAITRTEKNLFMSYVATEKNVSEFVIEAADSYHLKTDRASLIADSETESNAALLKRAKSALHDYYATGNRYCGGMILEYNDVCRQGADAIIGRARECGLI